MSRLLEADQLHKHGQSDLSKLREGEMTEMMKLKLEKINRIKKADYYTHALEVFNKSGKGDEIAQVYFEVAAIWDQSRRMMMHMIDAGTCEQCIDRHFVMVLDDLRDLLEGMKRDMESASGKKEVAE